MIVNPPSKRASARGRGSWVAGLQIRRKQSGTDEKSGSNTRSEFGSDNEISDAPAAGSLTNITVKAITVDGTLIETQQFAVGKLTIN